jgi:hypothetical protein
LIPYRPPSFLDNYPVLSKRIDGKKTWKSPDGKRLYQWDSQHGDFEIYSATNGVHVGCADKLTGRTIKPPVKGRRLSDV